MDALAVCERHQLAVLQIGMQLDLVRGDFAGAHRADRLAQQGDVEVRHADQAREALRLRLGQRAHELGHRHRATGRGPVDEREVHVVRAQLQQAVLEAGHELVARQVVGPDLGGDEQLGARHAALGDSLADLGFVAVDLRGVDQAVAQVDAVPDRVDHDLVLEPEGAQAEGGDGVGHGFFRCEKRGCISGPQVPDRGRAPGARCGGPTRR
ncbi:hypothetical protein D9M68_727820 [compost metagenome]